MEKQKLLEMLRVDEISKNNSAEIYTTINSLLDTLSILKNMKEDSVKEQNMFYIQKAIKYIEDVIDNLRIVGNLEPVSNIIKYDKYTSYQFLFNIIKPNIIQLFKSLDSLDKENPLIIYDGYSEKTINDLSNIFKKNGYRFIEFKYEQEYFRSRLEFIQQEDKFIMQLTSSTKSINLIQNKKVLEHIYDEYTISSNFDDNIFISIVKNFLLKVKIHFDKLI